MSSAEAFRRSNCAMPRSSTATSDGSSESWVAGTIWKSRCGWLRKLIAQLIAFASRIGISSSITTTILLTRRGCCASTSSSRPGSAPSERHRLAAHQLDRCAGHAAGHGVLFQVAGDLRDRGVGHVRRGADDDSHGHRLAALLPGRPVAAEVLVEGGEAAEAGGALELG